MASVKRWALPYSPLGVSRMKPLDSKEKARELEEFKSKIMKREALLQKCICGRFGCTHVEMKG